MGDFPGVWFSSSEFRVPASINTMAHIPVATGQIALGTTTNWPSANLAIYVPVVVPERVTVVQLGWLNGTTTTGDADVGIYAEDGTKIVSTGATARSGASAMQYVDITDTVIGPGLFYLALSNSGTGRIGVLTSSVNLGQCLGLAEEASASPLPASATFAAFAQTVFPFVVATLDTRV